MIADSVKKEAWRIEKIFEVLSKGKEGLLVRLLEKAPVGVVGLDAEGKVWLWNKAAEAITGLKTEEVLGCSFLLAKQELSKVLKEALEGKAFEGLEFFNRTGEEERWVRFSVLPLEEEEGKGGAVVFLWDATEEKVLIYTLRQSFDLFSALADSAKAGIFIHRGGPFLYVNRAAEELTGYKKLELLAMPFWQIVHPEDQALVKERARRRLKGEEVPSCYDIRFISKDGSLKWVQLSLAVVNYGGEPVIVGTAYDVTQLRNVQEELRRANEELQRQVVQKTSELSFAERDKEVLLYSISHDLRAPLRAIEGFSELLWEGYQEVLDERGRRFLENVLQAARKATRMFEDLLKYVKLGRKGLQRSKVDLEVLLRELLQGFERTLPTKAKVTLQEGLPSLMSDETLLRLIFLNLLDNAFKYRREGIPLEVEIGWREEEGGIVVYVKDNGRGIPEDRLEKVFNLFQRLTAEGSPESTGVGLAIAKKAAELLGGSIWVTSKLGQGSTFYVKLPLEVSLGGLSDRG